MELSYWDDKTIVIKYFLHNKGCKLLCIVMETSVGMAPLSGKWSKALFIRLKIGGKKPNWRLGGRSECSEPLIVHAIECARKVKWGFQILAFWQASYQIQTNGRFSVTWTVWRSSKIDLIVVSLHVCSHNFFLVTAPFILAGMTLLTKNAENELHF